MPSKRRAYINSITYKTLIDQLPSLSSEKSIPKKALHTLLHAVGTRHTINKCFLVFENLRAITSKATKICNSTQWHFVLEHITQISAPCSILLEARVELRLKNPDLDILPDQSRNKAFHGHVGRAPLYSTLGYLTSDDTNREKYYQLIAQLFFAHMLVVKKEQRQRFDYRLNYALDEIRGIASESTSIALSLLPEKPCSPEEYLTKLKLLGERKRLPPIIKYLEESIELQSLRSLTDLTSELLPPKSLRPLERKRLKTPTDEPDHPKVYEEVSASEDDEDRASSGKFYVFPRGSDKETYAGDFIFTAQQAANSRALENQLFPYSWRALNQHDLNTLFNHLFLEPTNNNEDIKARLQLALSFLAGMSPESIAQLELSHINNPPLGVDTLIAPTNTLRLISSGPEYKTELESAALLQAHPKQNYIDLELPDYFVKRLKAYLNSDRPILPTSPLFPDSPEEITKACSKIISLLIRKSAARLTMDWIQRHMILRLANMEGNDIAGTSLALGRDIYLARTKIHYAELDAHNLRQFCSKAWHDIALEAGHRSTYIEPFPELNTLHVGARVRPLEGTIKSLVERLVKFIEKKRTPISSTKELAEFHNAYILYTILLIAYSTGFRGVNTPFITSDMYDEITGFAVIRDKDTPDYYHSRLVWLTNVCIQHLKKHKAYIKQFDLNEEVRNTGPIDKNKEIFFLAPDGRKKYATRSEIESQLKTFGFHLPPNSHRHFLKSELQENRCSVEAIELMLGHWHLGQEGWVQTSALLPWDFKCEISKHLTPLLHRLGFIPIEGLDTLPNVKLRLDEWSTQAPKKKSARRRNDVSSADSLLDKKQPGETWLKVLNKRYQDRPPSRAFSLQQKIVLAAVHKVSPELYSEHHQKLQPIAPEQVQAIIRKFTPTPMEPRSFYLRMIFFVKGLEKGVKELDWKVAIPPRPVFRPKGYNRIRPQVMQQLKTFREIEEVFVKDIKKGIPSNIEERIGQIFFSAALFSGVNNHTWAEAFLNGLTENIYQYGEMLWVDLWSEKLDTHIEKHERWLYQRDPNLYRRGYVDPTTHALIYRWLAESPKDRRACRSLSLNNVFEKYLHRLKRMRGHKSFELETLKSLLVAGNAYYTLTRPPFISSYAQGRIQSASLPDPNFLRLLDERNFRVAAPAVKRRQRSNPEARTSVQDQHILLKELQGKIPTEKHKQKTQEIVREEIKGFIETNADELGVALELLAEWAIQLLSDRFSTLEHRKKKPEQPLTVSKYIGTFGKEFLEVCQDFDILEMNEVEDEEELCETFSNVVKKIYNQKARENSKINDNWMKYIVARLNQFLGFMETFYDLPGIHIKLTQDGIDVKLVRASLLSIPEYKSLLLHLDWDQRDLARHARMTLVATILVFRCGMRMAEIYGLLIGDIQGLDRLEALVKQNYLRKLKSPKSRRRAQLYATSPPEELKFIKEWFELRRTELKAKANSPLFTEGPIHPEAYNDKLLFMDLNKRLKTLTDDDTMVPYSLRHSFYTWTLLKLLLRDDIELNPPPRFLQDPEFSTESRAELRQNLLQNESLGRKALYACTVLVGHADPETGLNNYMHMCDWLNWYYMRHPSCAPKLTAAVVQQLSGYSRANANRIIKNTAEHPLVAGNRRKSHEFAETLSHPLMSTPHNPQPSPPQIIKSPINKLPPYDIAVHRCCNSDQQQKIQKPRNTRDIWVIKEIYNKISELGAWDQKRLVKAAEMMLKNYRHYGRMFEFNEYTKANRGIELLRFIGIGEDQMDIRYFYQRKGSEAKKERSFQTWKNNLEIGIQADRKHESNTEKGCLRIWIKSIRMRGTDINFDKSVIRNILYLFATLSGTQQDISTD